MKINVLNGQLTRHFNFKEFTHKSSEIYIDERFIKFVSLLEDFRNWYARPINITSAYRPAGYNSTVGGSVNSSHLWTVAVDFSLPKEYFVYSKERKEEFLQNVKARWIKLCHDAGFKCQCNFYDTYLHLGIGHSDSFLDRRRLN